MRCPEQRFRRVKIKLVSRKRFVAPSTLDGGFADNLTFQCNLSGSTFQNALQVVVHIDLMDITV